MRLLFFSSAAEIIAVKGNRLSDCSRRVFSEEMAQPGGDEQIENKREITSLSSLVWSSQVYGSKR